MPVTADAAFGRAPSPSFPRTVTRFQKAVGWHRSCTPPPRCRSSWRKFEGRQIRP
ncbi:unnamed protein product [Cladocopium goreaui]|uniref:Uncharacterized protein n=1 Tax=Cladocopium goreaui TaxID=2562237 RepID=A0A9P1M1D2_9DINO|nr:unnamed protein product [Cladocopium goreaui]